MSPAEKFWVGADPGGNGRFGVAILGSNGTACAWRVNCADEAVRVVVKHIDSKPSGVGVDAPLWWSSGRSSDRRADQWLRKTYKLSGGEVQSANSLRGAALVQGAMFILRIRECFPEAGVTETHPKALRKVLKLGSWSAFLFRFKVSADEKIGEHERDAIISAVAAREGFEGRWSNDLSANCDKSERDPSQSWLGPVHYFWPES